MKKTKKQLLIVSIIILGTFVLDFLFHYFLTEPMETSYYFFIKIVISGIIASYLFIKTKARIKTIIISASTFAVIFSIYYRLNEFFYQKPFGSRVPDIIFGTTTISYYSQPWLSVTIWGIIHFLAFFIPASLIWFFQKKKTI